MNARNDSWEELLEHFDIPESTANGAILLKQTYLRYLDPYEKIYFLGEDDDDGGDYYMDEEESRSRRQKAQKIQSTVPVTYNYKQHEIPGKTKQKRYVLKITLFQNKNNEEKKSRKKCHNSGTTNSNE